MGQPTVAAGYDGAGYHLTAREYGAALVRAYEDGRASVLELDLLDLQRNGRAHDSIGRIAADTHTSGAQVTAVLAPFTVPRTARERIRERIIRANA